ncbi:hypothetical protein Nepgr_027891 [Nepenthes gracilis]|uniref:Secreted protein n=1 Tax=Nepenthes gracilis TaxID=150966 RepID=A0AAD3TBC9_NEPGR|nr:hypothetical protein Nepgr_027891 [Nepenthes gracilis]
MSMKLKGWMDVSSIWMLLCPWRWSASVPSRSLVYSAAATAISSLFKARASFLSPRLPSQSNTPKALSSHLASTPFMSSNDGGRSLRGRIPFQNSDNRRLSSWEIKLTVKACQK